MADYIQTTEDENDPEATIELPAEPPSPEGASILLSTIVAQFPGATGLKYRNPESGTMRGLRVVEGRVMAPDGVWQNHLYVVTFPKENKRKGDDTRELPVGKTRKTDDRRTSDLIVLGLDFNTTVEGMKDYFSQYGELVMTQLKKDPKGKSKGFGFIRYRDIESQNAVNNKRHKIDDRWCEVKYPDSQVEQPEKRKLFVGRLSPDVKEDDIYQYFAKIGEVTDVFIPKEFRGFAFVTLENAQIAQSLIGQDHIINGNSVLINYADPKNKQGQNPHQQGGRPPFGGRDGGGFTQGGRGGYQNEYFRNKQGGGGNDGSGSGGYGGGGYNNMNSQGQGQMIPNNPQGGGGGMGNPAAAAMGILNPQGNMNQNQLNQAVLAAALNQAGLGMVGSLLMGGGAGMNALQAQATMAQSAAQGNPQTTPQAQNNPALAADSTAYQAQQQAAAMGWGAGNPAQGAGDGTGGQFYGAGGKQASGW